MSTLWWGGSTSPTWTPDPLGFALAPGGLYLHLTALLAQGQLGGAPPPDVARWGWDPSLVLDDGEQGVTGPEPWGAPWVPSWMARSSRRLGMGAITSCLTLAIAFLFDIHCVTNVQH